MEVKVYKRDTDCTQLMESITENTDLVRLDRADYPHEPIVRDVDLDSKIICGKETIMADPRKVASILDMELWMQNHMWEIVEYGDVVEFDGNFMIKTPKYYTKVEFKE